MSENQSQNGKCMLLKVTKKDNYRHKYMAIQEDIAGIENADISIEELTNIVKKAVENDIHKFHIVGGEPLLRTDLLKLVSGIKALEGVEELAMTTNGLLLKNFASELKLAGLDRVNINIDTLRYMRYGDVTGSEGLDDVVAGINASVDAGLAPLKLNVVVMKDFNEDEVLDFLQLTFQHDYEVRFVELTKGMEGLSDCDFVANEDIKKKMPALRPLQSTKEALEAGNGVSGLAVENYKYSGARGRISFISYEKYIKEFV